MSYAGNSIFLTAIIVAIFLQFFTPVHNGKHTCHYTKVIWTDNTALHQGWRIVRSSAEVLDKPSTEEEKKAQILLRIKAQIPYFMSALWFVYISRPRLILLSSQPCLNPKPVTHLSQPQFNLPGNGYIRLKLVIFSLQLLYWLEPFNSAYTLRRKATQITHSSIGCHILVLFSIGADSQERNEHQTILPLSPSPPYALSRHSLHLCSFLPSF